MCDDDGMYDLVSGMTIFAPLSVNEPRGKVLHSLGALHTQFYNSFPSSHFDVELDGEFSNM